MEVELDVNVTTSVSVDAYDVMDNLSLGEIETYVKKRCCHNPGIEDWDSFLLKSELQRICIGRCPRNMHEDNETIRRTINELMNEVLV